MTIYRTIQWVLRILFSWPIYVDIVKHDSQELTPKILAANHPATLDPVMMMIALNEQVAVLISQSVFNIPIIGTILMASGHIPVAHGQGRVAYETSQKVLKSERNLLIFPEGKLSDEDGTMGELFSGAVRLSVETGVPIVPVGISFSKDRLYRKKMIIKGQREDARFYLFGSYNITIGKPMYFSGSALDKIKMRSNCDKLTHEIEVLSEESAMRLYAR